MNPPHLEDSLQRDISRLRGKLTDMANLGERALRTALQALAERNSQLAYSVILRDQYIDELEKEIDRLCLEFLLRQQPVGSLLRFAYAAIKINLELERVGDYAESIARQALKLTGEEVSLPTERFDALANLSIPMLHDAIHAFVSQDAELAKKTIEVEEAVDQLKSKLNAELVGLFRKEKLPFEALNPLMMIARRLERVSDQARNICMEVLYMCTGEYAKHPGAEVFRILFVDDHNSCRSQIAEAVGNAMNQPRFVFSSAGLEPKPIDPVTVTLLREKGLDISRHVSKAISQVPLLDHYHVIVALAKEVRRAFPQRPRKVIYLDWTVQDPSKAHGSADKVNDSYEATFQFIQSHVTDLVNAVLGEHPK